ncbi:MAG TPA: helix-turn-helix domain-containing protein, partial [Candidatus Thermoplasmatota archaeon]|nr:helix-turn-helix domain-containing protein [Candidatus Thermoplasmatota archaeon]
REAGAPVGSAQAAFETSDALAVHAEPARKEPLEGAATVDDPHFRVPLGAGRATLTGNFTLYARGLDVTVREGRSGARVYETGNDSGQSPLPVHERKERWIVARVEGGRLAVERTVPGFATLYAGSLRAAVDGVVRLPDARGGFESGERAYLAEGDKVVLQGRLSLDLAPGAPARLPDEEARMRVAASGDLRSTNLRGVPLPRVAAGAPLPPAEAAILVCAGALLGRFLWVSYWRLQPDAALANAARRRLWETARARPGLSLRDLARAAGVSRTTAQYHAGVLARFGFLTLAKERDDARTVRVFALSDDPEGRDPRSRALAIALTREPARRLARALLDGGPATAPAPTSLADVARRTGLSKPTALRHLRALGRAGVVEARGRSPQDRSYALTPEGVARLRAVPALAVEA